MDLAAQFAALAALDLSGIEDDENGIEIIQPGEPAPRKRRARGQGVSAKERMSALRSARGQQRKEDIAILDFETDPFDNENGTPVFPFLAVLYRAKVDPIVIWEEDFDSFVELVIAAILALPRQFTVYAHNGGKFDYMFLIHKMRGECLFKGRAIMVAQVGPHEIRDSLHIIPEKLAEYKKDTFDYAKKLHHNSRHLYRDEIIAYCINDCKYLFEIVTKFIGEFGLKLSIGQAAMAEIRKSYKVARIGEHMDAKLRGVHTDENSPSTYGRSNGRGFFFGGRVECLAGGGHFLGPYRLYDVNSMYPHVMASFQHPIGGDYGWRSGQPSQYTCFVHLECDNFGALVSRGDTFETTATRESGEFFTTVHEYKMARKLGLIDNVRILACVDCDKFSSFAEFVDPLYENRMRTKKLLTKLEPGTDEYDHTKMQDMFYKFLLNNGYGKFAQNPRKFKENYLTAPNERPPEESGAWPAFPASESETYAVWQRPADREKMRFNNVGTGASITGAARSVLMEAIAWAIDPIYCDTDSLICRGFRPGAPMRIHNENLGAWKIEKNYDEVIIVGKKTYAAKVTGEPERSKKRYVYKSKGASGLVWKDYVKMLDGQIVETLAKGVTLTRDGRQFYMRRNVRSTAPSPENTFRAIAEKHRDRA